MASTTRFVRAILAALLLASPAVVLGKGTQARRAQDMLPQLKTGQWIQLESVIQKDSQVRCTALRLLAGDFLDDDWSLKGRVSSIDVKTRRFEIGRIAIHAGDDAVIENLRGMLDGLSDIRTGMIVEVDGTYLKNGTFRAKEIEDETAELRNVPGVNQRLAAIGKIERIDVGRRKITVMGIDFLITEKTQLKSLIR